MPGESGLIIKPYCLAAVAPPPLRFDRGPAGVGGLPKEPVTTEWRRALAVPVRRGGPSATLLLHRRDAPEVS